jgi:hypothetical protein
MTSSKLCKFLVLSFSVNFMTFGSNDEFPAFILCYGSDLSTNRIFFL